MLALRAEPVWSGPATFDLAPGQVRVVPGPSPLAVRDAMRSHDDHGDETLVVLTPCSRTDLGLDVCARLLKGTVVPVDPYAALVVNGVTP